MSLLLPLQRSTHGGHCECEQLAAALRCDPRTISFDFCLRVLQRHWRIHCNHGCAESRSPPSVARWKDAGRADAVKAILISNAPHEG